MAPVYRTFALVVLLFSLSYSFPAQIRYDEDAMSITFKDLDRISSRFLEGYLTIGFNNLQKIHINKNWIEVVHEDMSDIFVQIAFPEPVEIEKGRPVKLLFLRFPFGVNKAGLYELLKQ